jgi:hypothetical protein
MMNKFVIIYHGTSIFYWNIFMKIWALQTLEPASTSSSSNNNNEGNNRSKDDDNGNKATEGGDKKGFLARIFTWKNNQAKLPDDKNPSVSSAVLCSAVV